MTAGNWITVAIFGVGLALAGLGAYYALHSRVQRIEDRCTNHDKVLESIATLAVDVGKLRTDNEVFWRVIGPHLEDIIHSPKSKTRDALVAKLTAGTIGKDELPELIDLLHKAIAGAEWTNEKRFAGVLLLARATALLNDERYERRRTA